MVPSQQWEGVVAETTNLGIEIAKAGVDLIKAVVWPAAVVFLAWIFKSPLSDLLAALRELQVKGPGGTEMRVVAVQAIAKTGTIIDEVKETVESLKIDESQVRSPEMLASLTEKLSSIELKMGELAQANNAASVAVSRSIPWTSSSGGARSGFGVSKLWEGRN
jgi:hypothetical protein